jgi:hypothetical protein
MNSELVNFFIDEVFLRYNALHRNNQLVSEFGTCFSTSFCTHTDHIDVNVVRVDCRDRFHSEGREGTAFSFRLSS